MLLHFTKMEGCGNDYVYVNGFTESVPQEEKPALVRRLSDRHFGIGGDGMIFINPSEIADFEMEMYNADGSRAEMCGNGIRCVAKYVYDHGMTDGRRTFTVESFGKVRTLELTCENGQMLTARVDMGAPVLNPPEIPAIPSWETKEGRDPWTAEAAAEWKAAEHAAAGTAGRPQENPSAAAPAENAELAAWRSLNGNGAQRIMVGDPVMVGGRTRAVTCVSMGNPHAVVFPEEPVEEMDLTQIGPLFENHVRFPNRINTEFLQVIDREHVIMRVWERGTGETLACGTGACAAAVACVLNGYTDRRVEVTLPGGTLTIEWDRGTSHVYLTGPARTVFDGVVEI